ncbi:hypothetical protein OG588_15710 [Streptomyces prunicolor]|uniref:tetratricopeptide repeat protein n=1 Tax=Streptomyces prunicolor TaxID=67348 RepID=UPI00386B8A90|nr:hypothetical protein OG588_15710 [Streptomyces prunicolor]
MGEPQASIDWGETGSVERHDYKAWASQHVSRLVEEGRIEELRSAASTGTALARARLAEIYAAQGRIEELRALAGSENEGLALLLADTLAGQGDLEAKVAVMKVRLQVDEEDARDELIELLRAQDRIDQAITFLQRYTHEHVEWNLLVRLLLLQGRVKDVQLMAYEERGPRRDARSMVAYHFAEQGRIDELRTLVTPGSSTGLALLLARALVAQGRVDEGVAVLQERVDADEQHSRDWLIQLLVEQGRADQAVTALKGMRSWRRSTSTAELGVARLLDEQGRPEDAIRILRGTGSAPERLAALLAAQGRVDEAVRALDRAVEDTDARYPAAIERLTKAKADLLAEYDRPDRNRN